MFPGLLVWSASVSFFPEFLRLTKSVPQGSTQNVYADDTILYCWRCSANFSKLHLNDLKLVLNAHRTKWMLFSKALDNGGKNVRDSSAQGSNVESITEYNLHLGKWIDDKLTFKYYNDNLVNKLQQKIVVVFL